MRSGHGASLDRMTEIARKANQEFREPMMEAEVMKIAASAWRHDAAGLNFFTPWALRRMAPGPGAWPSLDLTY